MYTYIYNEKYLFLYDIHLFWTFKNKNIYNTIIHFKISTYNLSQQLHDYTEGEFLLISIGYLVTLNFPFSHGLPIIPIR